MTIEEHNALLTKLRSLSDTPEMAGVVQELQQDYAKMTTDLTDFQNNLQKAEEKADKYAKLNNDLFLQCSAQNKIITSPTNANNQGSLDTGTEPPKKRTYDDLEKEFI